MDKLNTLLDKHIQAIQREFKMLPKSHKNSGAFSGIMNKLDNSIIFVDRVNEIVNNDNSKMIDFINQNYLDDYTDPEMDTFLKVAKEKYADIIRKGLVNSLD